MKGKELFCWSLAYQDHSPGKKSELMVLEGDNDLSPLFKKLFDWKDKSHYRIVYVHNLSFDIRFLVNWLAKEGIEYKPILSGSNMLAFIIQEYRIKFVDTVQFLQCSQEKAEAEWGIESEITKEQTKSLMEELFENSKYKDKLKPFNLWSEKEKKELKWHCANDTKALHKIMQRFRETMFEISYVDCLSVISLASLAMKSFRIHLGETGINQIENPFLYFKKMDGKPVYRLDRVRESFVRQSYFGGRTEVFNLSELKNGNYIDRVSMYPSEMATKHYPIGYPYWEQSEEECDKIIDEYRKARFCENYAERERKLSHCRLGFINAKVSFTEKVETQYPILPVRLNKRTIFSNADMEGVFTIPELAYARQYGYKVQPKTLGRIPNKLVDSNVQQIGLIFENSEKIFTSFVRKFFKIKRDNEGGKKKAAKIILNSTYGKFGQKFERKSPIHKFYRDEDKMLEELDEDLEKWHIRFDKEAKVWIAMKAVKSIVKRPYMNVGIASYTTAYARLNLWEKLHEMEQKAIKVWYCDTDSITIQDSNLEALNLGHQLGQWDIEQHFDSVKFLAPKCYISIKEGKPFLKMKGVDKRKIIEIVETCKTMKEIETMIREPIELAEKYMAYTEALRYGQILATKKRVKHYSFENAKRNFLKDGSSIPWSSENIPWKKGENIPWRKEGKTTIA